MKKSTIYDDADRLMAIDEVAERLKTSPTRIAMLINGGFIRAVKFGRRRYIRKKIPTMVAVTIVGEDDAMYRALNKAIQRENRKRIARGEEPVQYIVNYTSELRPIGKRLPYE